MRNYASGQSNGSGGYNPGDEHIIDYGKIEEQWRERINENFEIYAKMLHNASLGQGKITYKGKFAIYTSNDGTTEKIMIKR